MATASLRGKIRLFALTMCVVLAAVLFTPPSPAVSVEPQPAPAPVITPPVSAEPAELTPTQEAKLEQKCESNDLEFVEEAAACSHGADPPPPGKNIYVDVKPVVVASAPRADGPAGSTVTPAASNFLCDTDGVTGPRTQVVYVRASDVPDRYAVFKPSILVWAGSADQVYRASAAETGGSRRIRFVHDSSCAPVVLNVVIPATADDEFNDTISSMEDLGYNRTDRNYMMFVDANVYCGVSTVEIDDRPGQENFNNSGPSYGRTDAGCWGGDVPAHEHMHNMGGVQMTAPHASGGMHCTDEHDLMCYSDEPDYPSMQMLCMEPMRETDRFDCNYDDYFNTNPPPGSYLATRWNTANSKFLVGGGAKPCPDQSTEPNDSAGSARPIGVGSTQSYAFCAAGDSDWTRFDAATGGSYRIALGSVAGGSDPALNVYGNGGKILLRSDDPAGATGGSRIDFLVPNPGTYYIRVNDNAGSPSTEKTYTVSVSSIGTSAKVKGWGYNGVGALGISAITVPLLNIPLFAAPEFTSKQVSAGVLHSVAVGADGSAWGFGWNVNGQLGDGTLTDRHTPVKVAGMNGNVIGVAAGGLHSLAVKGDGTVWAWGYNAFGQLGDGTTQERTTPVQVQGLSDVVEVAAGTWHSLALKRDGTVWAWGWNVYGGLGDGTQSTRLTPVKVPIDGVTSVSGGGFHTLAARNDGSVWAWGYNPNGQIGDGSRTDRLSPVKINSVSDVYKVAAGLSHSLALRNDGSIRAWGWNATQQVGSSDPADKLTPIAVECSGNPACPKSQGLILGKIAAISAGGFHSTALSADGKAWSWGLNNLGQLGDGTSVDSFRAVAASGGGLLNEIAAGFVHSLGG